MKQLAEGVGAKKSTLLEFINECGNKLVECQNMNARLNAAFEDSEMQKDNTKGLIIETFQSYKAMLENLRVSIYVSISFVHLHLVFFSHMHTLNT